MNAKIHVYVFVFFASLFGLFSGGRVGSRDALAELQVATRFAMTGHVGAPAPPAGDVGYWLRGTSGNYYEAHDIGNVVLMAMPAKVGTLLSHAPAASQFAEPAVAARFCVAIVIAIWSAVGCLFVVKLFALFYPTRSAFLLGLAFATATFFWPYTKSAWDVGGGCVGVCVALYGAAAMLSSSNMVRTSTCVTVAIGLVIAASFRYSLAPFLALSVGLAACAARTRLSLGKVAVAAAIVAVGMAPTFLYNYVRMGSPWRPATTAAQFASVQSLTGSIPRGLFILILSPNRGLVAFCPLFFLLAGLPVVWFRFARPLRTLICCFAIGAALYTVMIAKIPNAGSFGWGPRYLVPVLPIYFLPVAGVIAVSAGRGAMLRRALLIVSILINGAAVLTNWDLASAEDERAVSPLAMMPYQQMAVWRKIAAAALHRQSAIGPARFPDLWEMRLIEHGGHGLLAGLGGIAAMSFLTCCALGLIWRESTTDAIALGPPPVPET